MGDEAAGRVGKYVEPRRVTQDSAVAVPVRVDEHEDFGAAFGVAVHACAGPARAVDETHPITRLERFAQDEEACPALVRPERGAAAEDLRGHVSLAFRIDGLGAAPLPEDLRREEHDAADRDALFARFIDDLEPVRARRSDRRALETLRPSSPPGLVGDGTRRDGVDAFEPGAPAAVAGVRDRLPLGEGHEVRFELCVRRQARVLLGPILRQLEPGGGFDDRRFGRGIDLGMRGLGMR